MIRALMVYVLVSVLIAPAYRAAAFGIGHTASPPIHGKRGHGAFGATGLKHGNHRMRHYSDSRSASPSVVTIECGRPIVQGRPMPVTDPNCSLAHVYCDVETERQLPKRRVTDFVVITTYPNGQRDVVPRCWVPTSRSKPQLTAWMVRDEARKLLPHPVIGSAPPGHVTLVNIETVLWVATSSERRLGTVNLLGRQVEIRAHIDRVTWDFGDDSSTTTDGPGTAYTSAHPCRTKQCPGYFGHTYLDTGTMTISADLTWTGQFRVDGGAWQTIPGTVTAAATSTTVDVKEARGVLVPNP